MSNIKEKLSRLTPQKAVKILGKNGEKLLRKGGGVEFDLEQDVTMTTKQFIIERTGWGWVELSLDQHSPGGLAISSSSGRADSLEVAAALSLILEEKTALGLAEPPPEEHRPPEHLSHSELVERAISERRDKAFAERMEMKSADESVPWTDYAVTNHASGKTYKVALRGMERGSSFCSCPDFKTNTLGVCKHLIYVQSRVAKLFSKQELKAPYVRTKSSVTMLYKERPALHLLPGNDIPKAALEIIKPHIGGEILDVEAFCESLAQLRDLGCEPTIYPDAEEHMDSILSQNRIRRYVEEIRRNPAGHPLCESLLSVKLRPYQLDGIAFAMSRGRVVLADDMGLGKTIQGIGFAEFLAREARIRKTLVVCPTSLKSQWRDEVAKFTGRSAQLVLGSSEERAAQYDNDCFMTICNYEQVLRDLDAIDRVKWDLIILDEAQRIKNWESKTSRVIKSLNSRYALALTGTPIENRLEELYTIVGFIDRHHLGPAFKFMHSHRIVNENGKILGYKNLDTLRKKLSTILLRRTRDMVLAELPEKQTNVVRLTPTEEQAGIDSAQRRVIQTIVRKKYISEMDLLRLQKALLTARMAANSTYLVDKLVPHYSNKIPALRDMIDEMTSEKRKILIFSEWTTMLDLIEKEAIPPHVSYVRLDGSVPQKKRGEIVKKFNSDKSCQLFLTTNAGSTGLNLQSADTVINVDLPWNPAVLEQRIARAHRMGQKNPVHVYLLISEGTLEEQILGTLATKKELASNALDPNASLSEVGMSCGIDELKRRLEVLLGEPESAPVDASAKAQVEAEIIARKRELADAGGKLVSAAFEFLGKLAPTQRPDSAPSSLSNPLFDALKACSSATENGAINLTLSLPDESALRGMANTLAGIISQYGAKPPNQI